MRLLQLLFYFVSSVQHIFLATLNVQTALEHLKESLESSEDPNKKCHGQSCASSSVGARSSTQAGSTIDFDALVDGSVGTSATANVLGYVPKSAVPQHLQEAVAAAASSSSSSRQEEASVSSPLSPHGSDHVQQNTKSARQLPEDEKIWINMFGGKLRKCPGGGHTTGAYRDNYCRGPRPSGICVVLDADITAFYRERTDYYLGDLSNADAWCVFTPRFAHAWMEGFRPRLYLEATGIRTLEELESTANITMSDLERLAIEYPGGFGRDPDILV